MKSSQILVPISSSKDGFLYDYLTVLNGIFQLTPRELQVLHLLIREDAERPCSTWARRRIVKELELKDSQALNNIIYNIVKKGLLTRVDGEPREYRFHPLAVPKQDVDTVVIKFKKK